MNNNKKATIMKTLSIVFLVIALLIDIVAAFIGFIRVIGFGLSSVMIAGFVSFPALIIKVIAILLGHFRHQDWQCDYRKFFSYRIKIIRLIIVVDIVSIIAVGIISNFGIVGCGDNGCQMLYGRGWDTALITAIMLGFLSVPALVLGTIISMIDARRMKKKNLFSVTV